MESGPLLDPRLQELAKKHVMFLHVTTHLEDKEDDALLSTKVDRVAFPTILAMDGDGNVIGTRIGSAPFGLFPDLAERTRRYLAARARAEAGDAGAEIDALILAAGLGQFDPIELEERLEGLGELTPAQERALRGVEASGTVNDIAQMLRAAYRRGERDALLGIKEQCLALRKEGRIPTGFVERGLFWRWLADVAVARGRTELLRECVKELKPLDPKAADSFGAKLREIESAK